MFGTRIAPSGDVQDHASPRLASVRDQLRKKRSRLRETLDGYLRGKDTSKYLQDQIITERNGRFVLLVKAEHRSSLPGLVHGSSSSGATLYLEPLSTIDINNDVVALESDQAEEVQLILLELTDCISDSVKTMWPGPKEWRPPSMCCRRKARFAEVTGAVAPALSADGRLELLGARHPLLMKSVVSRYTDDRSGLPEVPTPVDIKEILPEYDTAHHGPEHGRQNGAAQDDGACAAHGPGGSACRRRGLERFRCSGRPRRHRRRAVDRGEPQHVQLAHLEHRIAGSPSARCRRWCCWTKSARAPIPSRAAPSAVAIVDHFRTRGATVIGTTHYDALKTYASTTAGRRIGGVCVRSCRVCAPLIHLVYGLPGRSLAHRNGEPPRTESPHRRSGARGARHARTAVGHSTRANGSRSCAPGRGPQGRGRRAREPGAGKGTGRTREGELRERENAFKRKLNDRVDERVRAATREIDGVVQALKRQASAPWRRETLARRACRPGIRFRCARTHGPLSRLRPRAPLAAGRRPLMSPWCLPVESRPARVGDTVTVPPFGLQGVVRSIADGQAEIDVHGKRLRARRAELRAGRHVGEGRARHKQRPRHRRPRTSRRHAVGFERGGLHRGRGSEKAERFLDETLVTEQRTVRVIHGHGTGRLQKAISGFLKTHPLVDRFHTAPMEQGGGGVTVIELKD